MLLFNKISMTSIKFKYLDYFDNCHNYLYNQNKKYNFFNQYLKRIK
jgi:hypothetical protein